MYKINYDIAFTEWDNFGFVYNMSSNTSYIINKTALDILRLICNENFDIDKFSNSASLSSNIEKSKITEDVVDALFQFTSENIITKII